MRAQSHQDLAPCFLTSPYSNLTSSDILLSPVTLTDNMPSRFIVEATLNYCANRDKKFFRANYKDFGCTIDTGSPINLLLEPALKIFKEKGMQIDTGVVAMKFSGEER